MQLYKKIKPLDKRAVYIDRLLNANASIYKELNDMTAETSQLILEVVEKHGLMQIWEKQKIAEGKEQSAREAAKEMLNDGEPVAKIAKWLKLPIEVIEAL